MVDYVLEFKIKKIDRINTGAKCIILDKVDNYAKFLSMSLTLGMFVPTDEDGNILTEPKEYENWLKAIGLDEMNYFANRYEGCLEYQEVVSKIIFEGFEFVKELIPYNENAKCYRFEKDGHLVNIIFNKTIEEFSATRDWLTLTQSAITKYQI